MCCNLSITRNSLHWHVWHNWRRSEWHPGGERRWNSRSLQFGQQQWANVTIWSCQFTDLLAKFQEAPLSSRDTCVFPHNLVHLYVKVTAMRCLSPFVGVVRECHFHPGRLCGEGVLWRGFNCHVHRSDSSRFSKLRVLAYCRRTRNQ